MDRIGRSQRQIEATQKSRGAGNIGGDRFELSSRARCPEIEIGEVLYRILPAALSNTDPPSDRRCEFGRRKVAYDQRRGISFEEIVGTPAERLRGEQRDQETRVEVPGQRCQSLSRSSLRRVPASVLARSRFAGRARSQSRSSLAIGRGGGRTGFSSITGCPRRVITIASPPRARSISFDSWFFASATLCVLIGRIAILIAICRGKALASCGEHAIAIIRLALELGVNFFDTAADRQQASLPPYHAVAGVTSAVIFAASFASARARS
jgi:hypothetical protein